MLYQILEANSGLPVDFLATFEHTGKECEATMAFIDGCSRRWRVPIDWIE